MKPNPSKILVADDDEAILEVTSIILRYMGYTVATANDGRQVHSTSLHQTPDLIILDVWMGETDGRDICRQLKSDTATSHIPVIMTSAASGVRDSAMASGANDFMEKPFDIDRLMKKIERLIA